MAVIAATTRLSANDRGSEVAATVAGNGSNGAGLTFPSPFITYQQGVAAQNAPTVGYPV